MTPTLSSPVILLMLMSATVLRTVAVSLSSRSSAASPVDHPDLSVHNILPSYRTEGNHALLARLRRQAEMQKRLYYFIHVSIYML